jgi:hypothetical protein
MKLTTETKTFVAPEVKHKDMGSLKFNRIQKKQRQSKSAWKCVFPQCYCLNAAEQKPGKRKEHLMLHILCGETREDETPTRTPIFCAWCGSNQNLCSVAWKTKSKHKANCARSKKSQKVEAYYKCKHNLQPERAVRQSGVNKLIKCEACEKPVWYCNVENHYRVLHSNATPSATEKGIIADMKAFDAKGELAKFKKKKQPKTKKRKRKLKSEAMPRRKKVKKEKSYPLPLLPGMVHPMGMGGNELPAIPPSVMELPALEAPGEDKRTEPTPKRRKLVPKRKRSEPKNKPKPKPVALVPGAKRKRSEPKNKPKPPALIPGGAKRKRSEPKNKSKPRKPVPALVPGGAKRKQTEAKKSKQKPKKRRKTVKNTGTIKHFFKSKESK